MVDAFRVNCFVSLRDAEVINYHYQDHNLIKSQAKEVSQQFRFLAVKLSQIDSLYDLKIVYKSVTIFAHRMADFQYRDRNYSISLFHQSGRGKMKKKV